MGFEPIKLNKAKCPVCSDILISTDPRKYEVCSCGQLKIGGGNFMLFREGKYKELSKLNDTLAPHDVNVETPTVPENKEK